MLLSVGINKQVNVVQKTGQKLGGLGGSMEILFTFLCYSVEEEEREPGLLLQTQYFITCLGGNKVRSSDAIILSVFSDFRFQSLWEKTRDSARQGREYSQGGWL